MEGFWKYGLSHSFYFGCKKPITKAQGFSANNCSAFSALALIVIIMVVYSLRNDSIGHIPHICLTVILYILLYYRLKPKSGDVHRAHRIAQNWI